MTRAEKRSRLAQDKRDLVLSMAQAGKTKAEALRAVKKQFGSGIASADVGVVYAGARRFQKPVAARVATEHIAEAPAPAKMRRFLLDCGGTVAAEGVQFSDGRMTIHGMSKVLDGDATIQWLDS